MPPDGAGGKGHFSTVAEMRAALADHEQRLSTVEKDLITLTDAVMKPRKKRRKKKAAR